VNGFTVAPGLSATFVHDRGWRLSYLEESSLLPPRPLALPVGLAARRFSTLEQAIESVREFYLPRE
jgi:hypothetical protein